LIADPPAEIDPNNAFDRLIVTIGPDDADPPYPFRTEPPCDILTPGDQFWTAVCRRYVESTPEQCAEIRNAFYRYQKSQDKIVSPLLFAQRCSSRIKVQDDVEWLLLGVAAISIDGCRVDFRDSITVLGGLERNAKVAGIDAKPIFKRIASISNRESSPTPIDMSVTIGRLAE